MKDQELLKYSQLLYKEAESVIAQSNFVTLFSKLGKISFVGSYALDLLYRRDIDVFVENKKCTRTLANQVTLELIKSNAFQTVGFADWTEQKPPNSLSGFYWQLIYFYKGQKWKFDVWYTSQEVETIKKTDIIKNRLSKNITVRLEILRLKENLFDGEKYRNGMDGFKIYESVLGQL